MALVTGLGLIYGHRPARFRVSRMTVGTADAGQVMLRSMPLVHVWTIMTLHAQILARRWFHVAVRIMTGRAIERAMPVGTGWSPLGRIPDRRPNLVWMDGFLETLQFAVASVAGVRRDRS
jgi:hypothetical protein